MLDKVLGFLLVKLGFDIPAPKASFTGGLVGDSSPFTVLPTVTTLSLLLYVLTFEFLYSCWYGAYIVTIKWSF